MESLCESRVVLGPDTNHNTEQIPFFKENTPRVASACADCPGFLVLGAAPAPASTLVSEPQIVPPGLAFCYTGTWTLLGSAAHSSPATRAKKGCTARVCTAQGGTRRLS